MTDGIWKSFEGKKVYIILKNGRQYSGFVTHIDDAGNGLTFIEILDKYGKRVIFSTGEVSNLEEEQ